MDEVLAIVRKYLAGSSVEGITFSVDPSFSERMTFGWHIGVRPTRYPRRMYVLYDELAAVAEDIAEQEGVNIFFVVGEPLEAGEPALMNAA